MNFTNDFKNQLSENINAHSTLLGLNKEINQSIKKISQALKKKEKFFFVVMADQLRMLSILQLNIWLD